MTKALQSEIEEIQKELDALNEPEKEEEQEEREEVVEEEQPKEEPVKEEPAKEEEKELDASGYRRLRLEKEAEKKRADALEARLREIESKMKQPTKEQFVDQQDTDYELEAIKIANRYQEAEKAVMRMEQEFKQSAPDDYDDVAMQYRATIYNAVRIENPDLSHMELMDATRRKILEIAANHKSKGYDPIERMYLDGKKMGFKEIPKEQQAEQKVIKPDLDKIAANKKRNAGTAGAKGGGERGQMTAEALADLPAHEYAKIPLSERMRIMKSLA